MKHKQIMTMNKLDAAYNRFDTWYSSSSLLIKLLVSIGIGLSMILLYSKIMPFVYHRGQEFGELLYNLFGK